jgi:hypothetical protein
MTLVVTLYLILTGYGDPIVSNFHHWDEMCVVTTDLVSTISLKWEFDVMGIKGEDAKCIIGIEATKFLQFLYVVHSH